jgi:hypothetical protein
MSVLISEPDHFRIEEIDGTTDSLRKLVGEKVAPVINDHDSPIRWRAYVSRSLRQKSRPVNEPSTRFIDRLFTDSGRPPHSNIKTLAGAVVWAGSYDSIPIDLINRFADMVMRDTRRAKPIVLVRHDENYWVFDRPTDSLLTINDVATRARFTGDRHGFIEVWPNISPTRWIELRAEMMDHSSIALHDNRHDRSYG